MSAVTVGKISSFGNGTPDWCAQSWQMLLDARSGAFPLSVASSPSGNAKEGVTVPMVSTYGNGAQEYAAQIWQILYDARTGQVPLVVTGLTPPFNPANYGTVISQPAARFTTGLTDGQAMASMTDQGGIAGNFTQASGTLQPLYKATAGPTGGPAALFDGVNDTMASGSVAHGIGTGDFWLGLVVNPSFVAGVICTYVFGAGVTEIFISSNGIRFIGLGVDNTFFSPLTINVWTALEIYVVSGQLNVSFGGVPNTPVAVSSGIANGTLNMAYPDGSSPFAGLFEDALLLKAPTNITALSTVWRAQFGL